MAQTTAAKNLEFISSGSGTLGLEVRGLDLRDTPAPEVVDVLKKKLADHGVLLFRDQELTEEQQLRFTECFGETIGHPLPGVGGGDEAKEAGAKFFYLTNDPDKDPMTEKKTIGDGALGWHSDLQYMTEPQVYSMLYGVEVPGEGGETEYCDMIAAYEALDDAMKERLAQLEVIHWFTRKIPPVTHPAVRTHPVNGKKALYVSPGLSRLVEGMEEEEGKALLKELCDHATQEQFCWAHSWRPGDVLMWDNRNTMHQRRGFDLKERRVVRRTQTQGEAVIP